MISRRFVLSAVVSIVAIAHSAIISANAASALTHTTFHDGWQITINESPSEEFRHLALQQLELLYASPQPPISPDYTPWCCLVGNYGGNVDVSPIADEGEVPFFRVIDDFDPFGVIANAHICDQVGCEMPIWFYWTEGSPTNLADYLVRFVDTSGELAGLPGLLISDQFELAGDYPVYVGQFGLNNIRPDIWAVTIAAVPEPTSMILCLIAMTTFGLRLRRARLGHRLQAD